MPKPAASPPSAAAAASSSEPPSLLQRASEYARSSAPIQLGLGIAYGTIQALTPGGVLAPSPGRSRAFEFGRGAGETATGIVQVVTGIGMVGGGGTAAGGGLVAAPATGGTSLVVSAGGAALATEGAIQVVQGSTSVVAGVGTLVHAVSMEDQPSSGSSSGGKQASGPQRDWKSGPNDIDYRGSGKTARDAVDEAFRRTGEPRESFRVTQWGKDANGKSFPTEWRSPSGAEVSVDMAHLKNGPNVPHVGWQTAGKRSAGGKVVGHILLDDVPVNR
jgi:hypothetical protein